MELHVEPRLRESVAHFQNKILKNLVPGCLVQIEFYALTFKFVRLYLQDNRLMVELKWNDYPDLEIQNQNVLVEDIVKIIND